MKPVVNLPAIRPPDLCPPAPRRREGAVLRALPAPSLGASRWSLRRLASASPADAARAYAQARRMRAPRRPRIDLLA